jgi:26S proteasome regulatory subunit N1
MVQKLMGICGEHHTEEDKATHQGAAVVGLAAVAMGESVGAEMLLRLMDNLLQYGDQPVRRAIPIAYALLCVSDPRAAVVDTLSKLSHDTDEQVSQNAVLALGFVGAGTNQSRVAQLLRTLAVYYAKEPNHLFLVRIAQGLLHMGKGLLTLSPFHSDSMLTHQPAMGALLLMAFISLDAQHHVLGSRHYLLYLLSLAMRPRMLRTLDADTLKPVVVSVRVGSGVDTVGQGGRPKTITGFQTHSTPVLLAHGNRAELASDEWVAFTPVLEGVVLVKKNLAADANEKA